jgi:hypothetical protein
MSRKSMLTSGLNVDPSKHDLPVLPVWRGMGQTRPGRPKALCEVQVAILEHPEGHVANRQAAGQGEEEGEEVIPYPSRMQWAIIWVSVLVAAHLWIQGDLSRLRPAPDRAWGLMGYLYPPLSSGDDSHGPAKVAFVVLVLGALLAWQASGWKKAKK